MFRLLFVLLTAGAVAHAWFLPSSLLPDGRIVGGTSTNIVDFPYQVSLQRKTSSGSSHMCGGSIYNQRTIVTAAHCLVGQVPANLVIKAGITQLTENSPALTISSISYNSKYNGNTIDYDVGVVILAQPLTYTDKIQPIPLATVNPSAGTNVVVTGWGTLSEGGSLANTLQKVTVPIVSEATCKAAYGSSAITAQMICAGVTSGGKDACQGDSGGPMALDNTLVGIVSWGYGCARPNYPGVYASVAALQNWIVNNAVV